MVTVELVDSSMTRVNESKLRLDHDPWHDVPLPPILEYSSTPKPVPAGEEEVWLREDRNARRFLTTKSGGPEWKLVYRRITSDTDAGEQ